MEFLFVTYGFFIDVFFKREREKLFKISRNFNENVGNNFIKSSKNI